MKSLLPTTAGSTLFALLFLSGPAARALDGEPFIHDPSTIMECDGKFYTYGTFGGGLVSEDGWTWRAGAERPGGGLAPDAIKIGDRYYISYASKGGGMSGGHAGAINTMWTKSLDPKSPDFGFHDDSVVVTTDGVEDCDAIDPAFLLDPNDGRLWLSYGTYFGFIRIIELDPRTGKRLPGNEPVNVAIDCEATALMHRDGWYYLLATHGTCCSGANSTYNIRVGRSRKVTGPYLDHNGIDMLRGGGKPFVTASGDFIGPGHFGLLDLGDDVQKFSCHYEADLEKGGRSVLDVRPLLWKDGWPEAGDNFTEGTYAIQSVRSGYALELGVDGVPMPHERRRPGAADATPTPVPTPLARQKVEDVSANWPKGDVGLRLGDYMVRPHQKWKITPIANAGGSFGAPFFKITIEGTDRALAATRDAELVAVPKFTGAPEQLWQIDQLTDGSYRIMPKAARDSKERLALTAVGQSTPTLAKFDAGSENARWRFMKP
jgi:arabinan endo-1,5-alpha-L-arabinosidase